MNVTLDRVMGGFGEEGSEGDAGTNNLRDGRAICFRETAHQCERETAHPNRHNGKNVATKRTTNSSFYCSGHGIVSGSIDKLFPLDLIFVFT